jgi:hypothetical protein
MIAGNGRVIHQGMENRTRGKNDSQPECNREGINDDVVSDDSQRKAVTQRLSYEEWRDDDRVVPDVEDAAEDLWNRRGQSSNKQAVAFGRR